MGDKYPDVDWYCDRCHANMNDQEGFNDYHYVCECTEFCDNNSISSTYVQKMMELISSAQMVMIL